MNTSRHLRIALIPGDGVGQEVIPAARCVLDTLHLPIEFVELAAGWETFQQCGTALPDETVTALHTCNGALFGAVSSPSRRVEGYSSPIIALRKRFDLYANLRPVVSAPVPGSQPGIDLLVVRENTECLYVKQEWLEDDGNRAIAQRVITRQASQRIAKVAFEQARLRGEQGASGGWRGANDTPPAPRSSPLVTLVHKANVLSLTDGLFRETALAVATDYPDVQVEEQLVDSMIYRLIREPQRYDVVLAPNLYGDIISDAAAALVGGLGLAPSANLGDHFVLAEPVHGSAPDIAGQGIANPLAAILAGALLLEALDQRQSASQIQEAVDRVLKHGPRTQDLGGQASTEDVTNAVIEQIAIGDSARP
jgi:homoisocitrate dehydrogenase